MFRKIISNLSFSPALVGQLSFYAKRLRKEEATRRVGLIFVALALVVQSFAVFSPPESANASNPSNFIQGGVSSMGQYLQAYDRNTNNIKDLYTTIGITRADLAAAKQSTFNSKGVYSWGLTSHFSQAQGERTYKVKTSNGGVRTFYYRPLALWDSLPYTIKNGSTYDGWVGKTSSGLWFAIQKNCGNLILKTIPPTPQCPVGTVGKYPDCTKPPQPVATCSALSVTKLGDKYQLDATAATADGAKVTGYIYTIKKKGKVVKTETVSSEKTTNTLLYAQKEQGSYAVEVTVKTSLGDRTSANCAKSFTIAPPAKCDVNPAFSKDSPECQPCPDDTTLWIKDEKCSAKVVDTKSAINQTQGNTNATTVKAKAADKIVYTLTIANSGKAPTKVTPIDNVADVVEYAQVIDAGGGIYNEEAKTITWPEVTIKPHETQTRMFTIQLAETIPSMGTGISDKTSYDCRIDNTFGNITSINVDCPPQKQVIEQTVGELPHTGPRENIIFASAVLAIATYFYARSRQMKKEVRLIRRDVNSGTI